MSNPNPAMSESKPELQNASSLHEIWRRERNDLLKDPSAAWRLAKKANGEGEHLLALEITEAAIAQIQGADSVRLRQQKGRALTALGSTDEARQVLEEIPLGQAGDPETLGLLGRVFKDLAAAAPNAESRQRFLSDAQRSYERGFERARDNKDRAGAEYCGINAATMAALLDDKKAAEELARETLRFRGRDDDYYSVATRGEAALILGDEEEASRLYQRAGQLAELKKNWADLASTKKQCRALTLKLYGRRDRCDSCFPACAVTIFGGHMMDEPGRKSPRFPASKKLEVAGRIAKWIADNRPRLSFSSAASGSDILFLEAAQAAGVETHLVLPFAAADFIESSVRPSGADWVGRFERVMSRAASKTVLNDQVADEKSSVYDFTNRMIAAKAALRATTLDCPRLALAVWNRQPGDGTGGTADAVASWCRAKIAVHIIHPTDPSQDGSVSEQMSEELGERQRPFDRTLSALPTGYRTEVCSLLHLFFAGYFGLRENQHQLFQQTVLGALAKVLALTSYPPISRYGLGADYVFVFDTERAAGVFCGELMNELAKALEETPELGMQLPRLCLHAGPIQLMVNPVLNQYTHEGATLTRAGRVARYVGPGIVYCTEAFASLAALESISEFRFAYAGTITYGDVPQQDLLFRIRFK